MTVRVQKRGTRYRIVDWPSRRLAMTDGGKFVDNGGWKKRDHAVKLVKEINANP